MIKKIFIQFLLVCSFYTCQESNTNQLDKQIYLQGPSQNNSNSYILFDSSGQGNLTKIYNSNTNQIQYIIPINDSMIKIIPGQNSH